MHPTVLGKTKLVAFLAILCTSLQAGSSSESRLLFRSGFEPGVHNFRQFS
jgi:hypothetical protein